MADAGAGDEISASRQSFCSSRAKLRFNTRAPAKEKTSHSRPPEMVRNSSDDGSKAKLNSTRITSENANDALNASLVRISERRSLAAMVYDARRNEDTLQLSPCV